MYTLYTDVVTTRRKRMHHVLDEDETVLWSGPNVSGALSWLYESGQLQFWIQGTDHRWIVAFHPAPE